MKPREIVGLDICHANKKHMCALMDDLYLKSEEFKRACGGYTAAWEDLCREAVKEKMAEIEHELTGMLLTE
jgi:hypothetical protein